MVKCQIFLSALAHQADLYVLELFYFVFISWLYKMVYLVIPADARRNPTGSLPCLGGLQQCPRSAILSGHSRILILNIQGLLVPPPSHPHTHTRNEPLASDGEVFAEEIASDHAHITPSLSVLHVLGGKMR